MIVKNEEEILARCLDSFSSLFDEIVIVDTGSHDSTKEIARRYTDRVYDFIWCDDFSAARNYAFSLCTCDYVYSCDADEVLDQTNLKRFEQLKFAMMPEVEIVQMKYVEKNSTVLNSISEYRPKLFKRVRSFVWEDPVHETVRLDPVVFDSDIEILHLPNGSHHSSRDFRIFKAEYEKNHRLSRNLYRMYAIELLKCGNTDELEDAVEVFTDRMEMEDIDDEALIIALCVLSRAYRLKTEWQDMLSCALKAFSLDIEVPAEIHYDLGIFYLYKQDYKEAVEHFSNALQNCAPMLDIHTGGNLPLLGLAECADACGDAAAAKNYRVMAENWTLPEGD